MFPGPWTLAWSLALALAANLYLPALATNLYLPALATNLYLPVLAPNLYLPGLAPNFYLLARPPICIYRPWLSTLCLPTLAPNLYLPALAPTLCLPQICVYRLSLEPEFAYTDLVSPICIYWPWPKIYTQTGC